MIDFLLSHGVQPGLKVGLCSDGDFFLGQKCLILVGFLLLWLEKNFETMTFKNYNNMPVIGETTKNLSP